MSTPDPSTPSGLPPSFDEQGDYPSDDYPRDDELRSGDLADELDAGAVDITQSDGPDLQQDGPADDRP